LGTVTEVDAPRNVPDLDCDVALWDVGASVPQALHIRFLALLSAPDDARAWLDAGAMGCILESASTEELLSAIRQVARGETFLSPPIVKHLVSSVAARPQQQAIEPLTGREREVLQLLARGLSNKDIAQKLYLSVRTVEGHLANIYGKLHVKSRTEAVVLAVQHGLEQ
jgi:DNA-binding NarL/FixJ family response regulator